MQYRNNKVYFSKRDVERLASRWPCFGEIKPFWVEFDSTGVVDISDTSGMDEAGVYALIGDYARSP